MSDATDRADGPLGAFPDDPSEAMASLGISLDESAAPDMSALDALKAQLHKDLDDKQGPFRRAGAVGRYWPFALALAFGAFSMVLLKPIHAGDLSRMLAGLFAGLSGVTCLIAAAWAPTRPGRGEQIATVGLLLGGVAIVVEGVVASAMPGEAFELGGTCAATMVAIATAPIVALFFGIKRAGLPVRRRHAAGMAVAALAMSGATVWMHCPADNAVHLFAGHMGIPLVIAIGLSVGLFHLFAPRQTSAAS
jgi:hypothetical protein